MCVISSISLRWTAGYPCRSRSTRVVTRSNSRSMLSLSSRPPCANRTSRLRVCRRVAVRASQCEPSRSGFDSARVSRPMKSCIGARAAYRNGTAITSSTSSDRRGWSGQNRRAFILSSTAVCKGDLTACNAQARRRCDCAQQHARSRSTYVQVVAEEILGLCKIQARTRRPVSSLCSDLAAALGQPTLIDSTAYCKI